MIGYKAFGHDFTCRGFQYEVGKTYEIKGVIKLCERGFHFCEKISNCFRYYGGGNTRFAKVEALGDVILSDDRTKCVTNKIKILEEISIEEAVRMSNSGNGNFGNSGYCNSGNINSGGCNSGNRNSGYYNSGNRNSGYYNSGDLNSGTKNSGDWNAGGRNSGDYNTAYYNSGDCNCGDRNSGDFNSGNKNSGDWNLGNGNSGDWNLGNGNSGDWNKSSHNNGCFMSVEPVIMMFNKPTSWTIEDWRNSNAFNVMRNCPTEYTDTEWISLNRMTDREKTLHPDYKTAGGYLKIVNHNFDRQAWWDRLSAEDKQEVMSLPNFDVNVFYECTGIKIKVEDE